MSRMTMSDRTPQRMPIVVDVAPIIGADRPISMRGWAMAPTAPGPGRTPVVYCQAGGGCSTDYFDLHVPGAEDYSMAAHLAERGAVVVAVDHLGLGESDPFDLFAVTPTLLARCHDHIARELLGRARGGRLVPDLPALEDPLLVGLGHSMGAMLTSAQQGLHRTFDALVLLGHGGSGLPEVLTADELAVEGPDLAAIEGRIVELARVRFAADSTVPRRRPARGAFFTDDVPPEVREAFAAVAVPTLPIGGLTAMIPHSTHAEKARVDAPTFLGFGDHDLVDDYVGTIAQFPALTDLCLFVLPESGHCQNQARHRTLLWDRVLDWLRSVSTN